MNPNDVTPSNSSRFSETKGFADVADPRVAGLVAVSSTQRTEIQSRAYAMWEQAGYPEKRELAHWLAAEAEILHRTQAAGP